MKFRQVILILFLSSSLLSSCIDGVDDEMISYVADWLATKDILSCSEESGPGPEDCDLQLNELAIARYMGGIGKDEGLQAIVDTGFTARQINNADALAEEAFANGDLSKLEEAQKLRPDDWSYDQQASVLILVEGNSNDSAEAAVVAEQKVQNHVEARINNLGLDPASTDAAQACATLYLNMHRHRETSLITQINKDHNGEGINAPVIDQLWRELELVERKIDDLSNNPASRECVQYGGG
jgi:hypothetical protein